MRCLQRGLPIRQGRGLAWGPCSQDTPTPRPRAAQPAACSEEIRIALSKLLNRQLPRRKTGFANRELPARPKAPWGRWFLVLSSCALRHPARAHLWLALLSACHTSVFKKSPRLPQRRGVKGGRPARRARCQGRPDLHRARAGGSARSALGPAQRSPPAQTRSALPSAPEPRSVHPCRRPPADPAVPSRPVPSAGPAPPGPGRAPSPRGQGPEKAGGRILARRVGGQGSRGAEWGPARPGAGRADCPAGADQQRSRRASPGRPPGWGTRTPRALLF